MPGARLERVALLAGGTSARLLRVWYQGRAGDRSSLVVRIPHPDDAIRGGMSVARECAALAAAGRAGVPVPAVLAADRQGQVVGRPAVALEYVAGRSGAECDGGAGLAGMAADCLARIHRAQPPSFDAVAPGTPPEPSHVLLHGDFWPGNLIIRDGRIAAVLDWEDSAYGHRFADLANARLEIAWFWGDAATAAFTAEYARITGCTLRNLAAWDLAAAARKRPQIESWGLAEARAAEMRAALDAFAARAANEVTPG